MQAPVGPLPAAVYWRRRASALAALVVVLLAGVWVLTAVRGSGGADGADPAVAVPSVAAGPSATTPGPASGTGASSAVATLAPSGGVPAGPTVPAGPAVPPAAPGAAPAGPAVPPGPVPAAAPPGTCGPPSLVVAVQAVSPEFRVGTEPEFRLLVTNTGPQPCTVDVDPALQEVLVHLVDGVTRLWSSNDCYARGGSDVRTLVAGQQLVFPVTWSGLTSAPGCVGERVPVLGGEYRVVARLGSLVSAPVPFRLA